MIRSARKSPSLRDHWVPLLTGAERAEVFALEARIAAVVKAREALRLQAKRLRNKHQRLKNKAVCRARYTLVGRDEHFAKKGGDMKPNLEDLARLMSDGEWRTTRQVAEALDLTPPTAQRRLKALAREANVIWRRITGRSSYLIWRLQP